MTAMAEGSRSCSHSLSVHVSQDCDTSIRRRALEVLIALLSPQNIRVLGRELLSFLLICDKELKPFAAARLAMATETHAPTRRWQFDATLKLLCLAGTLNVLI